MQTDIKSNAAKRGDTPAADPPQFTKRIGSTTYKVSVHFSKTSKETMNDKILRLITREGLQKIVPQSPLNAGKREL